MDVSSETETDTVLIPPCAMQAGTWCRGKDFECR